MKMTVIEYRMKAYAPNGYWDELAKFENKAEGDAFFKKEAPANSDPNWPWEYREAVGREFNVG